MSLPAHILMRAPVNANAGSKVKAGAGREFTHILLMDDDAIIEPDSIVRLYGLLTTLRDEWSEAAVGGSMMREDFPGILYENGSIWDQDHAILFKGDNDMCVYEHAVADYVMKPYGENERFSGWWFYCAPVTTMRSDNLPLPIFIHRDDIEYCIRNQAKGIIFLNGIGIWHRPFDVNDPSMNVYSYGRNGLIMTALHTDGAKQRKKLLMSIFRGILISYTVRYRYTDIELLEKAVDDFLKGPDFIMYTDPEQILKEVQAVSLKFRLPEEWAEYGNSGSSCVSAGAGNNGGTGNARGTGNAVLLEKQAGNSAGKKAVNSAEYLTEREYKTVAAEIEKFGKEELLKSIREPRKTGSLKVKLSLNGCLLPASVPLKAVPITASPVELYRVKKAVVFEPYGHKSYIGVKNYRKLFNCLMIALRCMRRLSSEGEKVSLMYREKFAEMTSVEFWEKYLGL